MQKWMSLFLAVLLLWSGYALAEPMSRDEMTASAYGAVEFTMDGMNEADYREAALANGWVEILSVNDPYALHYDLAARYTWSDIETLLYAMSAHEATHLYAMGETDGGRRIYCVTVGSGPRTILLSGGLQAREPAGTGYILRQLCELITLWDTGDSDAVEYLSRYTIVAVPCCNPDGRAILEADEATEWRANAAGIDLSLNFPTANAAQLGEGVRSAYHATETGAGDFGGVTLGSEKETRLLIGWLEKYIDSAAVFIDYEQYGRHILTPGSYLTDAFHGRNRALAVNVAQFLSKEDASYAVADAEVQLRGWNGGSLLDYAAELAEGLVFSPAYGRLGLSIGATSQPLGLFSDIDEHIESYAPRNDAVALISIELSTKGGAAYYDNARRNHLKEYENCGYDELLFHLMEYADTYLSAAY